MPTPIKAFWKYQKNRFSKSACICGPFERLAQPHSFVHHNMKSSVSPAILPVSANSRRRPKTTSHQQHPTPRHFFPKPVFQPIGTAAIPSASSHWPASNKQNVRARPVRSNTMRSLKYFALIAAIVGILVVATPPAHAQVSVGIGVGGGYPAYGGGYYGGYPAGPPVCQWGYYNYAPYACAPYGYYGPQWFYGGVLHRRWSISVWLGGITATDTTAPTTTVAMAITAVTAITAATGITAATRVAATGGGGYAGGGYHGGGYAGGGYHASAGGGFRWWWRWRLPRGGRWARRRRWRWTRRRWRWPRRRRTSLSLTNSHPPTAALAGSRFSVSGPNRQPASTRPSNLPSPPLQLKNIFPCSGTFAMMIPLNHWRPFSRPQLHRIPLCISV